MLASLLWGRDDSVTPVAVRLRREARVCVYPSGYFPLIEAARASNRNLAAFLGEVP